MPSRAMQCVSFDARNERCVGPLNHPGSHHCEDGVWELPKLETPNATSALAVLNKNRRTGVPLPPTPVATKTAPSLLNETQQIRQRISQALNRPGLAFVSASEAVSALLDHCDTLTTQITALEKDCEVETYTATFLRKCLNLPAEAHLSVRNAAGYMTVLDDDGQPLQAEVFRRRKW